MNTGMIDNDTLIRALKQAVLHTFGRTLDSTSDFDLLSVAIKRKTGENLSPSTLKRIFGYVKYDTVPRTSTLSVLARYAGYSGWSDFCGKNDAVEEKEDGGAKSVPLPKRRTGRVIIPLAMLAAAILATVSVVLILNPSRENDIRAGIPQPAPLPVTSESDIYNGILASCRAMTLEKCDSVKALKGGLSEKEYIKLCQDSYFQIVFTQMKSIIGARLLEAFPDDDNRLRYDGIFSECRDIAVNELYCQFSAEDYQEAYGEDNADN